MGKKGKMQKYIYKKKRKKEINQQERELEM